MLFSPLGCLILLLLLNPAGGVEIHVDPTTVNEEFCTDSSPCTFLKGLEVANDGDELILHAGEYSNVGVIDISISSLTLLGCGTACSFSGTTSFSFTSGASGNVVFANFKIVNGNGDFFARVHTPLSVSLENVRVENSFYNRFMDHNGDGGVSFSQVSFDQSEFSENLLHSANSMNGVFISSCEFHHLRVSVAGEALFFLNFDTVLSIIDSVFDMISGPPDNSVVNIFKIPENTDLYVDQCYFNNNFARVFHTNKIDIIDLRNSNFVSNVIASSQASVLHANTVADSHRVQVLIESCVFSQNRASNYVVLAVSFCKSVVLRDVEISQSSVNDPGSGYGVVDLNFVDSVEFYDVRYEANNVPYGIYCHSNNHADAEYRFEDVVCENVHAKYYGCLFIKNVQKVNFVRFACENVEMSVDGSVGGCLYSSFFSELTISDSTFRTVTTRGGGAALHVVDGSSFSIQNSLFEDISSGRNGGPVYVMDVSTTEISNSDFRDCSAGPSHVGGAIYIGVRAGSDNLLNEAEVVLTSLTFEHVYTASSGVVYVEHVPFVTATDVTFRSSHCGGFGMLHFEGYDERLVANVDGFLVEDSSAYVATALSASNFNLLTFSNAVVRRNWAYDYSVLTGDGLTLIIDDLVVEGNVVEDNSAFGFHTIVDVEMYNVQYRNNSADWAIYSYGFLSSSQGIAQSIYFENVVCENNVINGRYPCVIFQNVDVVELVNCKFENNFANDGVAASVFVEIFDSVTVDNCQFINNTVEYIWGAGAALFLRHSHSGTGVTVQNSLFENNNPRRKGGAMYLLDLDVVTIQHCSFMNNSARYGGVVWAEKVDTVEVLACEFLENFAMFGGVLHSYNSRSVSFIDSEFRMNSVNMSGGVLYAHYLEDFTSTNSVFEGNRAIRSYPVIYEVPQIVTTSIDPTSIFKGNFDSNCNNHGQCVECLCSEGKSGLECESFQPQFSYRGGKYNGDDTPSSWPPPREAAGLVALDDNSVLLIAGYGMTKEKKGYLNDIWKYSIDANTWLQLKGSDIVNSPSERLTSSWRVDSIFSGRAGIAAGKWNGEVAVFGGVSRVGGVLGELNELFLFDISSENVRLVLGSNDEGFVDSSQSNVFSSSYAPSSRYYHSGVVINDEMLIFGGLATQSFDTIHNDLWSYSFPLSQMKWISGVPNHEDESFYPLNSIGVYGVQGEYGPTNCPGARHSHVSFFYNGKLGIFGGQGLGATNEFGYLGDLWIFDFNYGWMWKTGSSLANGQETVASVKGTYLCDNEFGFRSRQPSAHVKGNEVYFFGGNSELGLPLQSLFSYSFLSDSWRWVAGDLENYKPGRYGGFNSFEYEDIVYPTSRHRASFASVSEDILVLFGGSGVTLKNGIQYLSETHVVRFNDWTHCSNSLIGNECETRRPLTNYLGGGTDFNVKLLSSTAGSVHYPGSREYPVVEKMTDDGGDEVLLFFGGNGVTNNVNEIGIANEMFWFYPSENRWRFIRGSASVNSEGNLPTVKDSWDSSIIPRGRIKSSSASLSSNVVAIFGGLSMYNNEPVEYELNDLVLFRGNDVAVNWVKGAFDRTVECQGHYELSSKGVFDSSYFPSARWGHSSIGISGEMWIFGGNSFEVNGKVDFFHNDLWHLRSDLTFRWVSGQPNSNILPGNTCGNCQYGVYGNKGEYHIDNTPGTRYFSSLFVHQDTLCLFSGVGYAENSFGALRDLWKFSLMSETWKFVHGSREVDATPSQIPSEYGTYSQSNLFGAFSSKTFGFSFQNEAFFFGGSTQSGNGLNLLASFSFKDEQFKLLSGKSTECNGLFEVKDSFEHEETTYPSSRIGFGVAMWSETEFFIFGGKSFQLDIEVEDGAHVREIQADHYLIRIIPESCSQHNEKCTCKRCSCTENEWIEPSCERPKCSQTCLYGGCELPGECVCHDPLLWQGENCDTPVCAIGCESPQFCLEPGECLCKAGFTRSTPGDLHCQLPICFGKSGDDACSGPQQGYCDSPDICVCEVGYSSYECEEEIIMCYGYLSTEIGVCGGVGDCVGNDQCDCHTATTGRDGPQCERWKCATHWNDEIGTVCSGNGACLPPETGSTLGECSCFSDDIHGHCWSEVGQEPCSHCQLCVNGNLQGGECVCHEDDIHGYWTGNWCGVCKNNYYDSECKTYCLCVSGSGIESGECLDDGSACVCYSDPQKGFFSESTGYYATDCKDCLLNSRFNIQGKSCRHGFYKPSFINDATPLNSLFFDSTFKVLWGYFLHDGTKSGGSCKDIILTDHEMNEECNYRLSTGSEAIFSSGAQVVEEVNMLVIYGTLNVLLGDEFEISVSHLDDLEDSHVSTIAVVKKFSSEYSDFGIDLAPPKPILKTVLGSKMISEICGEQSKVLEYNVVASNPDGSFESLKYELLASTTFEHSNEVLNIAVPIEIEREVLAKENVLAVRVINRFGESDEIHVPIVFVEEFTVEIQIDGNKWYSFPYVSEDVAMGSIVLKFLKCGEFINAQEADEVLISLRTIDAPGDIDESSIVITKNVVTFYKSAFPVLGHLYVLEITANLDGIIGKEIVSVFPYLSDLVIEIPTSIQQPTTSRVFVDGSSSFDPMNTDELESFFWKCSPGCSEFLQTLDGSPCDEKTCTIPENSLGSGNYTVEWKWSKGKRAVAGKTEVELLAVDEGDAAAPQVFFVDVGHFEKQLCSSPDGLIDFEYEDESFMFFFSVDRYAVEQYYENGEIKLVVSVENSMDSKSFSFFEYDPPVSFIAESTMYVKKHFENQIGLLNVYYQYEDLLDVFHEDYEKMFLQNELVVHFSFFKDYFVTGENEIIVIVEVPGEGIYGETRRSFIVHEAEQKRVGVRKMAAYDPNMEKESCKCRNLDKEFVDESSCQKIHPLRVYTIFDIQDGYHLFYRYEKLKKKEITPSYFDGVEYDFTYTEQFEQAVDVINRNQNWATITMQDTVPFKSICKRTMQDSHEVHHFKVDDYELLVAGSEDVQVYNSITGCRVEIVNEIEWDVVNENHWLIDKLESGDNTNEFLYSRRSSEDIEEIVFSLGIPKMDVSAKTTTQRLFVLFSQINDFEKMLRGPDCDILSTYEEIETNFQSFLLIHSENPEPDANFFKIVLSTLVTYTKVIALLDSSFYESLNFARIEENLLSGESIVENMMILHTGNKNLKLLLNPNMNLLFQFLENVDCIYKKMKEFFHDTTVKMFHGDLKQVFDSILISNNVNRYDESVEFENDSGEAALSLIHSKSLSSNGQTVAIPGASVVIDRADATKIIVERKSHSDTWEGGASLELKNLIKSDFVSLKFNNEDSMIRKGFGVEFTMRSQMDLMKAKTRRTNGGDFISRPYCYARDLVEWKEMNTKADCSGLADFFSEVTGKVICSFTDVPMVSAEFVAVLDEFRGCIEPSDCPTMTLCNSFVHNNVNSFTIASSSRAHSSSLAGSSSWVSEKNENNGRRDEDSSTATMGHKTIKSFCMNEHVGIIVTSDFRLFVYGSSELNDHLIEDTDVPIEVDLSEWEGYVPKKVVCSRSSVWVLAYNPEEVIVPDYNKLFAFGRNSDMDLGGVLTKFTQIENGVFDVAASSHALYVLFNDRSIQSIGQNRHGSLATGSDNDHSFGVFEEVDSDNFSTHPNFVDVFPKITALENGVVFTFYSNSVGGGIKEYYAGALHPDSGEDVNVPVEIIGEVRNFDFISSSMDGCIFIVKSERIFVNGLDDCLFLNHGNTEDPAQKSFPNTLFRELQISQYGDFLSGRENCVIYNFICKYACYLLCQKDSTVYTWVWGPQVNDILFNAVCPHDYCGVVTLGSTGTIFVSPGVGERSVGEDGSLEIMHDVFSIDAPGILQTIDAEGECAAEPELLFSESGMVSNHLNLKFKKEYVFGESEVEIRFVEPGEHGVYLENRCVFPFYDKSFWSMQNIDEGMRSFNVYSLSMDWKTLVTECGFSENALKSSNLFTVYSHRVLFVGNYYLGTFFGRVQKRRIESTFDINVLFPKDVLRSDVVEINGDNDFWSFFVTDKTFDRLSRLVTISISVVSTFPNYFRLSNPSVTLHENQVYLKPYSLDAVEPVPVSCNENYCYQTIIVSFSLTEDSRVCSFPLTSLRVNLIQTCQTFDHYDCVEESINEDDVSVFIEAAIPNLCDGVLALDVLTTAEMDIYSDWTYEDSVSEDSTFTVESWLYFKISLLSDLVSIDESSISKLLLRDDGSLEDIVLYENDEITANGHKASVVFDQLPQPSESESEFCLGFHLQMSNELLRLQPEDSKSFSVIAFVSVLYSGNSEFTHSDSDSDSDSNERRDEEPKKTTNLHIPSPTFRVVPIAENFSNMPLVVLLSLLFSVILCGFVFLCFGFISLCFFGKTHAKNERKVIML